MMSRPPPTCLGCLRRSLTTAMTGGSGSSVAVSPVALTQVRGKKKRADTDTGIVVRLLRDIPEYGPKDSIMRVPRGRVRNMWYPTKKAEYMTTARFRELGVNKSAIVERDPTFGLDRDGAANNNKAAADAAAASADSAIKLQPPKPKEAAALMEELIPATLTFHRAVVPSATKQPKPAADAQPQPVHRSPLVARNAAVSAAHTAPPAPPPADPEHDGPVLATAAAAAAAIFGSVGPADIAARARDLLLAHPEAALIPLDARHVRIHGLDADAKIKHLGTWKLSFQVPGADDAGVDPVNRILEVVEEKKETK